MASSSHNTATDRQNDDLYPGCVFLKVIGFNKTKKNMGIKLTINFGEENLTIAKGNIRFGLRRGELCLRLQDAEIPLEKNLLTAVLDEMILTDVELEKLRKNRSSKASKTRAKLDLKSAGLSNEEASVFVKEDSDSLRIKLTETQHQVRAEGSEKEPRWIFEAKGTAPVLLGGLIGKKIATIEYKGSSVSGNAIFRALQKDIIITELEGFGPTALSFDKRKILKFLVARLLPKDDGQRRFSWRKL